MKIDDLQEVGAREELKKILSKEPQELTDYESKFLRARRSYLSREQRFKYSGVLYFSRPALYHEIKTTLQFLSKFTKEIIFGVIVAIVVLWIIKLSGWKP
ncbi:MAG: hypothetical protein Q7K55_06410 [Candidatus Levybacteria bacterium]|nr:hypothetical protein [Candidatus Levybacteria bacterium]